MEKEKSRQQEKAYHRGFSEIASLLVENNVTLNKVIQNLEIRPTKESIKDVFRHIARQKYGIDSTSHLKSNQVDEVWEDLVKAISESTGVFVPFPSRENTEEYITSLDRG